MSTFAVDMVYFDSICEPEYDIMFRRSGQPRDLLDGDLFFPLPPDKDRFRTQLCFGDAGDVDHCDIHAHKAEYRRALARD